MGNEQMFQQKFSLDGSRPDFTLGGRFALRVDARAFVSRFTI
jgi:hypothetical protein